VSKIRGGWFKSSFSNTGGCVEVNLSDVVQVRDSKDPHGAVLTFTAHEWCAFLQGVLQGEFDLQSSPEGLS
jgi:hypothetical protein